MLEGGDSEKLRQRDRKKTELSIKLQSWEDFSVKKVSAIKNQVSSGSSHHCGRKIYPAVLNAFQ